ncbi:hypothetical protein V6N13_100325 [Hibiscus sabdariffa]|uniref:BHLH domain-containing protein n=2 Tax=Hibiscus sabdariffa TaxID=183260 RepID=A0ABR2PCB1_9ROSI
MEKDQGFMAEGKPARNSCSPGMEMQTKELKNCFLNPNWDNSMDQGDPFESALSSMACSPAASNAGSSNFPGSADNVMMRELIGKLGNICNTISPQSFINPIPNNNTSPLNSPPELNLSMVDSQMRGNLKFPSVGNQLLNHPSFAPISADPEFAERAARIPCFGVTEAEFPQRLVPTTDCMKITGSQPNVTDNNKSLPHDGNPCFDQIPGVDSSIKGQNDANARKRKSILRGKAKETPSPAPADTKIAQENDESDAKRSKQPNGNAKEANDENQKQNKETPKPPEPPKDYIHVRARRGQATDSHSLAERVRREKISERMKFLQDLVPGCNKVTGKAVMLDEIINYVQSLQRQVEFLSMKLATVNPRMNVNMVALLSKDMFQSRGSLPHALYSMDSSAPAFGSGYQPQQALPLNNGMSNNTEIQFSMNPISAALHKTQGLQLPPVDSSTNANPQIGSFFDDDLQSIVQMGFGQIQPQSYQSSKVAGQVKMEM